jgi:predicted RNA binding protein YcfA (HicA-like mRNA interferase family)
VPTPMRKRDVERALRAIGCHPEREGGRHTLWRCACGDHQVAVPRHREVSGGVVEDIRKKIACGPKGWL